MIRLLLNVASWIIMGAAVCIALIGAYTVLQRSGSFGGRVQEISLFVVLGCVTFAAGGVLQMLVSIDQRLELSAPWMNRTQ